MVMKHKIESLVPPRIYKANDGKSYILPNWIQVFPDTTMDDVIWIKPQSKIGESMFKAATTIAIWKPEMGENKYNTHFNEQANKFFCSCPGFWRTKGECKHVKALKESQSV
jgi:hypothetical protein